MGKALRSIGLALVFLSVPVAAKDNPKIPREVLDANAGVSLKIPRKSRVLIRSVSVIVDGVADPSLQAFAEPLIRSVLSSAGFSVVASAKEVMREASEREWERASPEIHKGSLPPPGTILRENVEVTVTVHLVRSSKQMAAVLGELARQRINIGGFLIRKKQTGAIVFAQFVDNVTQTGTAQLVTFATNKDESFALTGTPFGALLLTRDEQRKRDLNALRAAVGLLQALLVKKLEDREPIRGSVLGKVEGVTTTFVAINIGAFVGVEKGALFAVHPVRVVGGERVALPPVAKIRALVVNDTNSVCDILEGSLDHINEGDEVREIRPVTNSR
ncbi:MAG: hypothetical protein NZ959_04520 [Armatimonadetes bacterium]|nr:hypothetical protein [Armatimonadota bacterium]MDW8121828.1 hypothetical protein [Armatimonadota bacterium]